MPNPVICLYCTGSKESLMQAAAYLVTLRMAYYYSKDFIRVKTRVSAKVASIERRMRELGMSTRRTYERF